MKEIIFLLSKKFLHENTSLKQIFRSLLSNKIIEMHINIEQRYYEVFYRKTIFVSWV